MCVCVYIYIYIPRTESSTKWSGGKKETKNKNWNIKENGNKDEYDATSVKSLWKELDEKWEKETLWNETSQKRGGYLVLKNTYTGIYKYIYIFFKTSKCDVCWWKPEETNTAPRVYFPIRSLTWNTSVWTCDSRICIAIYTQAYSLTYIVYIYSSILYTYVRSFLYIHIYSFFLLR